MQINRLFEILYLLLEEKTLTAAELARRFEVSARTVYRDVEALSAAGIPVYMSRGRGGGISLLPGYVLNKAVLTDSEKADILASLKALGRVTPGEADGALSKLSGLLGKAGLEWIEVDFSSWNDPRDRSELFYSLKAAILSRRIVTFLYASGKGELTKREAEPLKLCFKGQAWYLYAYCHKRRDFRFFKLRRMRELSTTDERFERSGPPDVLPKAPVPAAPSERVTLRLSEAAAFRVFEEFDDYERAPGGGYIVRTVMPPGGWLFQYVASFGEHCEVMDPPEVRREFAARLQKILEKYR